MFLASPVFGKTLRILVLCYIASLHLLLAVMLWKSDFLEKLQNRLFDQKKEELTAFYNTMLSFHLRMDARIEQGAVLFIGDSMTQGLCVSCMSGRAVNFGIGGDTTRGVLNRIVQYQSVSHAKAVVLQVGLNDLLWRDDEVLLKNYTEIIRSIPESTNLIISPIFPVDSTRVEKELFSNSRIEKINKALNARCVSLKHCTFIEMDSQLRDRNGNLKTEYHMGDGVHLSPEGYGLWENRLKTALLP